MSKLNGPLGVRRNLELLKAQLDNERSTFISHWRDLSDYVRPRRARFYTGDTNKGDKRNQKIIDSTATLAERTLRAGMMSGLTSPARPWFRLTTPDPDLAEFNSVKQWLYQVQNIMLNSFLRSNLYNTLPLVYGDNGLFGTAPMSVEESFTGNILHTRSYPVGSYMIAKNWLGIVDTFILEFRMTVRQIVQQFGQVDGFGKPDWSNISTYVKNEWDQGNLESWVEVVYVVKPNDEYDPNRVESKFKKFKSCYYESGVAGSNQQNHMSGSYDMDKLLSEKGFDYFPILCPRWEVTGEDVYGTSCPGMDSLGDIKQLQLGEKKSFQAIEKMINPPMVGPSLLKNQSASLLPGDITYLDEAQNRTFRAAHDINFRIQEMEMKQNQIRDRINRAWFTDLFLMIASAPDRDRTATEIAERKEEKLLALGPVLEQMNQDLLDPIVDVAFDIHMKQGLIPPPPEELQGVQLKVEYLSVMAQAQKLVGLSGVERFAGFVGQIAGVAPEVLDKVNSDQIVDVYAEITSIPPGIVRSDDEVAGIRDSRAQAAQRQQQSEMLNQASQTAKNLAQAPIEDGNALNAIIGGAQSGV